MNRFRPGDAHAVSQSSWTPLMLLCLIAGSLLTAATAQESQPVTDSSTQEASAYVQRMMSLDKNGDGFLESAELPGALRRMLKSHDRNGDQKLSRDELTEVEVQAESAREESMPAAQREPVGAGRRGRGGASRVQGSPLDAEQILKFALTFDVNRDGTLNAEELKRYAVALAGRRAQSRAEREAGGEASDAKSAPAGAAGKAGRNTLPPGQQPLKERPVGLGTDGKGDGGFGDEPGKPNKD